MARKAEEIKNHFGNNKYTFLPLLYCQLLPENTAFTAVLTATTTSLAAKIYI